jgi:hypothetical protein
MMSAGLLKRAVFIALAAASGGWVFATEEAGEAAPAKAASGDTPYTVTWTWPKHARAEAMVMLEEYGEPSRFDREALVWEGAAPWKRVVVSRQGCRDEAYLEQTIGYRVAQDKAAEIEGFSDLVSVDRAAGELKSCSESESKNYLALNLARDIAAGERSAQDARAFFAKTWRMRVFGRSSPYLKGLLFEPGN